MPDANMLMKYEGGDADQHAVDMRLLGRSLQGFDRIISDGVVFFIERRAPKRRERAIVIVKAKEPQIGSNEIVSFLQAAPGILPFAWTVLTDGSSNFIWRWVSFVLSYFGGRKKDAEIHLDALMQILKDSSAERQQSQDQWMAHEAVWRDKLFAHLDRLVGPAIQAVAPVGPSVRSAGFSAGTAPLITVDEAMADAIRSKGELDVGDLQEMTLRLDGFVHHTRRLNVENPEEPGQFLYADVKDPLFDEVPNVYTEAANRKATITVQAKQAHRAGKLERIYIMDFGCEIDQS